MPLELVPTEKIIDLVRAQDPTLFLVTFTCLEGVPHEVLPEEARRRLDRSPGVVANRGEETRADAQVSYAVTRDGELRVEGKPAIARAIADLLERHSSSVPG